MTELDDHQLLAEFARADSQSAFATLAGRYVNLVYSVALRQAGNTHAAQEITQAVFIILARKAGKLSPRTVVSGWLYQTTRLTAANYLRTESRRCQREQEAYMQTLSNEPGSDETWQSIAPLLDDALGKLGERDRNAIVLRFLENKSLAQVGQNLGASEAAAKMRVNRALEKLRKFFTKRGVSLTTTLIAGAVAANSVSAAPVGLATAVATTVAKGTLISGTITTLVKGTMNTMTWLKLKFAASVGAATILAGGVATVAISQSDMLGVIPAGGHAGVTFFSILEKTPIVANAVFEREYYSKEIPPKGRKQTLSFKLDGNNYFFGVENGAGISVGRYGQTIWYAQAGFLSEYDPKINKSEGPDGGARGTEAGTRMTVDQFLNLGITEIKPGSATWDETRQHLTGVTADGMKLDVDITLENGVPSVATVFRSDGQAFASIRYKYAPSFYEGRLPYEFTRYWGGLAKSDARVFTIRVKALEISDGHLNAALLDPAEVLKGYSRGFYSNNISYSITPKGKTSRVLTIEENNRQIELIKAKAVKR